ncbi:MAG TPA: hypothetical protein VE860_09575 [Chthoniobacterales bacterium]|nr:hypothetical protein [Chthoniobacterales bacterium]
MELLASVGDWWNGLTFSLQVFWSIGLFGLLLVMLQGVLSLVVGHHGDSQLNAHETHGIGYLSLKTLSALFIGLGFAGAILNESGCPIFLATIGGLITGIIIVALYLILMNALHRLRSDGTALLWEAIGHRGRVYMRIPANESAPGEIQVAFGGRFMNVKAFTRGPELVPGTDVLVISVHGENALEVAKASEISTLS